MSRIRASSFRSFVPFVQIFFLLCLSWASWKMLHRTPVVPPDVYPYLTSLSPDLVLECQNVGKRISPESWVDLLALQSSLTREQSVLLSKQLQKGIFFDKLMKETAKRTLLPDQIQLIKKRREYLLHYPLFDPNRYLFPVGGNTWYEDTWGADREGGKRRHEGTDLFGKEGTPIFNVTAGKIEQLGWNRLGGERVGVRGEDGNYYYYAHLQSIEPDLKIGQRIAKGTQIGTMGHTGDALVTPDHLHFGIELPDGTWVNPYPFLKVWQGQGAKPIS